MVKLYEYALSGNCYKVRLLLTQLGVPFLRVPVDIGRGESRTPEFLARVPFGRVPAVELEDGAVLAESNAILCYFAEGTPLFPADRRPRAEVLQWLFWEQYDHEPYVAVPRAWLAFFGVPAGKERELADRQARGYKALDVLERRLAGHPFLVADHYTIADIALYAYTHVAGEGQIDLSGYGAVRAWLDRVRAQERHVRIDQ